MTDPPPAVPSPPTLRLFVAALPEPDAASALRHAIEGARELGEAPELRWLDPDKLHLTLRFLGRVGAERVAEIAEVCSRVAAAQPAFELTFAGGGAFGSARRATVLWIGTAEGSDALVALASELEQAIERLGFAAEARAFKPHLTIARSRTPVSLRRSVAHFASLRVTTPVREIVLMRSHLGQTGRYEVIARCPLAPARP